MEPINWFMLVVTQHYFDVAGRARRAEFWWYFLVMAIGAIPVYVLGWFIGLSRYAVDAYMLALFLPTLSAAVRRMQDTNRPAIYVYAYAALSIAINLVTWIIPFALLTWPLGLVGFVAAIAMIVLLAQPGTPAPNTYGPDPKAGLTPVAA